jgi:Delta3-Delta2-enoyl-CoA isomerase
MRNDRGFFCLPEVDINIPFTPGMTAMIKSRLTPYASRLLMLTGARLGGMQAKELGVVDEAVPGREVLSRAAAVVAALASKNKYTLASIKKGMNSEILALLELGAVDGTQTVTGSS